jgi:hypothetical protein
LPLRNRRFIQDENKKIQRILNQKSFWSDEPKYPEFLTPYDENNDLKHRMGQLLMNTYMVAIIKGMLSEAVTAEQVKASINQK